MNIRIPLFWSTWSRARGPGSATCAGLAHLSDYSNCRASEIFFLQKWQKVLGHYFPLNCQRNLKTMAYCVAFNPHPPEWGSLQFPVPSTKRFCIFQKKTWKQWPTVRAFQSSPPRMRVSTISCSINSKGFVFSTSQQEPAYVLQISFLISVFRVHFMEFNPVSVSTTAQKLVSIFWYISSSENELYWSKDAFQSLNTNFLDVSRLSYELSESDWWWDEVSHYSRKWKILLFLDNNVTLHLIFIFLAIIAVFRISDENWTLMRGF